MKAIREMMDWMYKDVDTLAGFMGTTLCIALVAMMLTMFVVTGIAAVVYLTGQWGAWFPVSLVLFTLVIVIGGFLAERYYME